jgi:hypothetical protein
MTPEMDPHDEKLAEQLFQAARREAPPAAAKRQALLEAARARRTRSAAPWLLVAAAAALVLGLGFLARALRSEPHAGIIGAEPLPVNHHTHADAERVPVERSTEAITTTSATAPPVAPSHRAPVKAIPPPTMEEELGMLDRARQAMLAGDTRTALAALAKYDHVATSRHLLSEATLLKIQVLAASGRKAEASALANEFVAHNPNSPLVDRARGFIQKPATGEPSQGASTP